MSDRFDQMLRERVGQLIDQTPQPKPWDDLIAPAVINPTAPVRAAQRPRSPWAAVLAGAAAAVVLIGGVLRFVGGGEHTKLKDPPSTVISPDPTGSSAAPVTTAEGSSTTSTPSLSPTTSTIFSDPEPNIVPLPVSYLNPPPDLTVQTVLHASLAESGRLLAFPDGVIGLLDVAGSSIELFSDVGTPQVWSRTVTLNVPHLTTQAIGGPEGVLYALTVSNEPPEQGALRMVAVALHGPKAGSIVAQTAILGYGGSLTEDSSDMLGLGIHGVVAHGEEPLIDYVHPDGSPLAVGPVVPPYRADRGKVYAPSSVADSNADDQLAWELAIETTPGRADVGRQDIASTVGPGTVVYDTLIGADDDGNWNQPVVALLQGGRSFGSWYSLPDGWEIADAELWGTYLIKRDGTDVEIGVSPELGYVTGQTVGVANFSPGTLGVGVDDVVAQHADGDLYLHRGALDGTAADRMRLTTVGNGTINDVGGLVNGRVLYINDGELFATDGTGDDIQVGLPASHVAANPNHNLFVAANGRSLSIVDARAHLVRSVPYGNATGYITAVAWEGMNALLVVVADGTGGANLVRLDPTTFTEWATAPMPAMVGPIGYAIGATVDGQVLVAASVKGQPARVYAYDRETSLTRAPGGDRQLSDGVTVTSIRVDGSLLWQLDHTVWFNPRNAGPHPLAATITTAWFAI